MPNASGPSIKPVKRLDFITLAGVAIGLGGILGGLILEKGKLQDVQQITAAIIVVGGTLGAMLVSAPGPQLMRALRRGSTVFVDSRCDDRQVIEIVVYYANLARRNGIVSLENDALAISHPFLRKGLLLAVDGVETQEIRGMLELDLRLEEERVAADARLYESAGGYAPTIGIIGAVLGLIQVMKHLENIGEVGKGIAVAFVATVYGVGLANLLLLPAGAKIRARAHSGTMTNELLLEGVLAIAEGMNPKIIRTKLEAFIDGRPEAAQDGPRSRREAA
jgi:chemotaxis protein MotA